MWSKASTLHNLSYAYLLCMIDQTHTFSLAHCPICAGIVLFCAAGVTVEKSEKR